MRGLICLQGLFVCLFHKHVYVFAYLQLLVYLMCVHLALSGLDWAGLTILRGITNASVLCSPAVTRLNCFVCARVCVRVPVRESF